MQFDDAKQPRVYELASAVSSPQGQRTSPLEVAVHGPRAFAAFVGRCDEREPVKQIGYAVNAPLPLEEFEDRVALLVEDTGWEPVRDAVVSLLYARAQSRSWRYTRVLSRERQEGLAGLLGTEIDSAPSATSLQQRLAELETWSADVPKELLSVLHTRAHSGRWQRCAPIRKLLASRRLAPLRSLLCSARTRVRSRRAAKRPLRNGSSTWTPSTFGVLEAR